MHKDGDSLRCYSCIIFTFDIEIMIIKHVFCWGALLFFPVTFVIKRHVVVTQ